MTIIGDESERLPELRTFDPGPTLDARVRAMWRKENTSPIATRLWLLETAFYAILVAVYAAYVANHTVELLLRTTS